MLDHIIALDERHLRRLIRDYVNYHHEDRIHDSLDKDTPNRRPVDSRPSPAATVISSMRLGGLHHRYNWCDAAWQARVCRLDAVLCAPAPTSVDDSIGARTSDGPTGAPLASWLRNAYSSYCSSTISSSWSGMLCASHNMCRRSAQRPPGPNEVMATHQAPQTSSASFTSTDPVGHLPQCVGRSSGSGETFR